MSMEKAKHKSQPNIYDRIEGRREFDFVSQRPAAESAMLLEERIKSEKSVFLPRRYLHIVVKPEGAKGYRFTIDNNGGTNSAAETRGYLEATRDDSTRIYGYGRVNPKFTIIMVLFTVGATVAFVHGFVTARLDIMFFAVLYLLFLFVNRAMSVREREHQIAMLEETLLLPEEKPERTAGEVVESV
jgi:hypothetical protein